mmetsp:Transcript_23803/g.26723  ORF Transcript_23803/g.26723 Transcript_23803/m.26723 type:complete len:83 (-) Transcript_23803:60-308(-)
MVLLLRVCLILMAYEMHSSVTTKNWEFPVMRLVPYGMTTRRPSLNFVNADLKECKKRKNSDKFIPTKDDCKPYTKKKNKQDF